VYSVSSDGPSFGKLKPADLFVSVDGKPAASSAALESVMKSEQPGSTVPVVVQRDGKTTTVQIALGPPLTKGGTGASLGIRVSQTICQLPFAVDLGLGNEIGGPSAGMMFALGIMDKVGPADLTHGRFIAGTGTITADGEVGPIGGIQLKMIAARRAGATIFLAPAANCSDVRGAVPAGLDVIKVSTLHQAVQDLAKVEAGKPVPHC
jgi:PDZ domain-containing protein